MATQKKAGRSGGGGLRGGFITLCTLLLLGGAVIGWAKVNDINNPKEGYGYFRAWSDKTTECTKTKMFYQCWGLPGSDSMPSPIETGSPTVPTSDPTVKPGEITPLSEKPKLLSVLDKLTVVPPAAEGAQSKFVASQWPYWVGSPCTARDTILKTKGKDVKFVEGSGCAVASGTWTSPFSATEMTSVESVNVVHSVPPKYAADHGGAEWTEAQKKAFSNDISQLEVASAEDREKKSTLSPSQFLPEERVFQCQYAKNWTATLSKYKLTITEQDKLALRDALQKC